MRFFYIIISNRKNIRINAVFSIIPDAETHPDFYFLRYNTAKLS
jgi:hypothetical protein